MAVTIYDIAKKCNCSTATVSKVFNNSGNISKSKRDYILKVAKEINYVPNASAKGLASIGHSTKLIAVMLYIQEEKSITHELFSSILNAFRIEMEKVGFDICFIGELPQNSDISYISKIRSRGCDGVFVLSASQKDKLVSQLINEDIPLVSFDNYKFKNSVSSDNRESVARMVDYLVKKGHTRIAYIMPPESDVSKVRLDGFIEGLRRNNIKFEDKFVIHGNYFNHKSTKLNTDAALNNGFKPSVIMYPDDYSAISAIGYLKELGYKVPNDICVTGFDGIELSSLLNLSITTISQNTVELGKAAARSLYAQIQGKQIENRIVVPTKLIEGSSVIERKK